MQKILIKKVGQKPEILEVEEVNLSIMQKVVGGHIEMFEINNGKEYFDVILNEEGKLSGMKPNLKIIHNNQVVDIIVGDIMVAKSNEEGESLGLNDKDIESVKEILEKMDITDEYERLRYAAVISDMF